MIHQGELLKNFIKEKGLTQDEFAEKMGMTREGLRKYFHKSSIKAPFIEKSASILNIDKELFYTEEDPVVKKSEVEVIIKENEYLKKITTMQEREIHRLEEELRHYKEPNEKGNGKQAG